MVEEDWNDLDEYAKFPGINQYIKKLNNFCNDDNYNTFKVLGITQSQINNKIVSDSINEENQ